MSNSNTHIPIGIVEAKSTGTWPVLAADGKFVSIENENADKNNSCELFIPITCRFIRHSKGRLHNDSSLKKKATANAVTP